MSESIDQSEAKFLFAELFAQEFGISVVEEFGDNVEAKFIEYFKQADTNKNGVLDLQELFVFYQTLLHMGEDDHDLENANDTIQPVQSESKVVPVSSADGTAIGEEKSGVVNESLSRPMGVQKSLKKGTRRYTRNKKRVGRKFVVEPTAERENCSSCNNLATPMYSSKSNPK